MAMPFLLRLSLVCAVPARRQNEHAEDFSLSLLLPFLLRLFIFMKKWFSRIRNYPSEQIFTFESIDFN